ncbi:YceD family protein [Vogesella oryzae]|uniref:YceD family protein n=1 Tax=Vogesella oryzae TaxID=1735285 RepID=UPI0015836E47|nr:YceD family protein [Vogesella oryzae]
MSNPILIDPLAFARDGGQFDKELAIADLDERVHEVLASTAGAVKLSLSGFSDRLRRPSLRYALTANVELSCQRCLGVMPFEVESEGVITLFVNESKLDDAVAQDEELDAIMAEDEFDVLALIEDEIIMGLPLSAKHDDCGSEHLERAKADKPNPFAVLATLKKSGS